MKKSKIKTNKNILKIPPKAACFIDHKPHTTTTILLLILHIIYPVLFLIPQHYSPGSQVKCWLKRDGKWLLYIWMTKKDIHPSKNVTPVVFKPIYIISYKMPRTLSVAFPNYVLCCRNIESEINLKTLNHKSSDIFSIIL